MSRQGKIVRGVRRLGAAALLVGVGGVATGCQLVSDLKVSNQLFRQNIIACTQAIQRGDLVQAEIHLGAARPLAESSRQQMQLRSLQALIEGAEALVRGDGQAAEAFFSQIEDPYLRREIRAKARQIDLRVPLSPLARVGGVQ